jgi:hypothetical protein
MGNVLQPCPHGALSQSTLVPTKIVLRNNFVALKLWGFIGYGDNGII